MTVSLRELQEQFLGYVINEEKRILENISTLHADSIERIDIYRKGYSLRLLEILEKQFPILCKIIGNDVFARLGYTYIEQYPSHHFNICTFSRHFSRFLTEQKCDDVWAEIAQFEWALSLALDAADAPQLTLADLGGLSGEDWPFIQFSLHPSVEFYQFDYNVPKVVIAHLLEEPPPELTRNEATVNWMVWRYEIQSYFESLTTQQLWMMHAIKEGKTFAEICEGLCQWFPEEEVAQFAAGSLSGWIQKGIFSEFSIAPIPKEERDASA